VGSRKVQESVSVRFVVSTVSLSLGNAQRLQVKIQKLSKRSIEFDLVGVDASISNALRRILIAEV
jgi:DNA-directed RNA polymerase alpha subunit